MAVDQSIMLAALQHHAAVCYQGLMTINNQKNHYRSKKAAAEALFDEYAELKIAITHLQETGVPYPDDLDSATETKVKEYIVYALTAYGGKVRATTLTTENDAKLEKIDEQMEDYK